MSKHIAQTLGALSLQSAAALGIKVDQKSLNKLDSAVDEREATIDQAFAQAQHKSQETTAASFEEAFAEAEFPYEEHTAAQVSEEDCGLGNANNIYPSWPGCDKPELYWIATDGTFASYAGDGTTWCCPHSDWCDRWPYNEIYTTKQDWSGAGCNGFAQVSDKAQVTNNTYDKMTLAEMGTRSTSYEAAQVSSGTYYAQVDTRTTSSMAAQVSSSNIGQQAVVSDAQVSSSSFAQVSSSPYYSTPGYSYNSSNSSCTWNNPDYFVMKNVKASTTGCCSSTSYCEPWVNNGNATYSSDQEIDWYWDSAIWCTYSTSSYFVTSQTSSGSKTTWCCPASTYCDGWVNDGNVVFTSYQDNQWIPWCYWNKPEDVVEEVSPLEMSPSPIEPVEGLAQYGSQRSPPQKSLAQIGARNKRF